MRVACRAHRGSLQYDACAQRRSAGTAVAASLPGTAPRAHRPTATLPQTCTPAATASADQATVSGRQHAGAEPDLSELNAEYIRHCQAEYGIDGLVSFGPGVGGLPAATLRHPCGSAADVYLHGANVASWRGADGLELLHLRSNNAFDGEQPISGGITVAWPQYGAAGPLPSNGFLNCLHWSAVHSCALLGADDPRPTVTLFADSSSLGEGADREALLGGMRWPHSFEAVMTVTLMQPAPEPAAAGAPEDEEGEEEGLVHEEEEGEEEELAAAETAPEAEERKRLERREQRERSAYTFSEAAAEWGEGEGMASGLAALAQADTDAAAAVAAGGGQAAVGPLGGPPRKPPVVLRCMLQIFNTGDTGFSFTTGLNTHFSTVDSALWEHQRMVKLLGMAGKYSLDYRTTPLRPKVRVETRHVLYFSKAQGAEERDHVMLEADSKGEVLFCRGTPSHFEIINQEGYDDIGVVHPLQSCPEEAPWFVCIPSARVARPVRLQPGERWGSQMQLRYHDRYWDGITVPEIRLEEAKDFAIPVNKENVLPRKAPEALL